MHVLYTDNGTNFCGVDNTIRNMYNKIAHHQNYQRYYRLKQKSWYFNTPLVSLQGGTWELLIRFVRHILSALQNDPKNKTVNCDALCTMLSGKQRILNVPLLTPVSSSVEDCKVISSSSFIHSSYTLLTNLIGVLLRSR